MAVEAFFMISGFYMTLVLNEKYIKENSSYSLFITQRLLRLYPIYWVVLGLTLLVSVVLYVLTGDYLYSHLAPSSWLVLLWTNLCIIGQDAIMFTGVDKASGLLYWTTDFRLSDPQTWTLLYVPQAWSLSIEILFYLIAPFLMRRKTAVLVLLTLVSIGIRLYLYTLGLHKDPWSYRFLPCELAFFFIGGLAYRAYAVVKKWTIPASYLWVALASVVLSTVVYQFLPPTYLVQVGYYLIFAIALPFNFLLTKKATWDYKIGELSYPVYISHMLVLMVLLYLGPRLHLTQSRTSFALVGLTIPFAMLLVRFIADPMERLRQRRVKKEVGMLRVPAV